MNTLSLLDLRYFDNILKLLGLVLHF